MRRQIKRIAFMLTLTLVLLSACSAWANNMLSKPQTTRTTIAGDSVVIGDHPFSATAGFKILEKGGNAFDAAVAMAATMSLVYAPMNNFFGGDAMIIVYSAKEKKVFTYNGSGWAPEAATIDYYIEKGGIPDTGILSVQMPGSFAGWMKLLQDYGTMPLKDILAPAIHVANNGYEFPDRFVSSLETPAVTDAFNQATKDMFYKDGKPMVAGDMVYNKDYAKILTAMGKMSYKQAEDYFYRGPIAKKIVDYVKSEDGIFTLKDFSDFKAEKVDAMSVNYRGVDVYACPPNSQGIVLLEALNIVEGYDLQSMGHNSAQYIDILAQALNLALEDRNRHLGDPRFVKNPMGLLSKEYAKARRERDMTPGKPMGDNLVKGDPSEFSDVYYGKSGDTTFMAVADKWGNIVACTTSICNAFGSGLTVPGTGILLNNRMTYFFLEEEYPNHLQPRKRTMQTITPSIAMKDGKPYLAFGTPGADVQEQGKLQVFLNVVEWGMEPQLAVEAPRVQTKHPMGLINAYRTAYPRTLQIEKRVPESVRNELKNMGYTIQSTSDWEYISMMGCIEIKPNGRKYGGADPRSDRTAIGW